MRPPLAPSCRSRTEYGRRGAARAIASSGPECRTELPFEHGKNARLNGVKDDIIETEVTVRQSHHTVIGGHMRLEPLDELVHLWHCPPSWTPRTAAPSGPVAVRSSCPCLPKSPSPSFCTFRPAAWITLRGRERKQDEPCRVARASFVAS